jgi:hypothetical protein
MKPSAVSLYRWFDINFTVKLFSLQESIMCCHVDDFLHAGNETFEAAMCKLRQRFLAGKIEEGNFRYINIGFQITQNIIVKNIPLHRYANDSLLFGGIAGHHCLTFFSYNTCITGSFH